MLFRSQITKSKMYGCYELLLEGSPKVMNRRKYPRLPITNTCEVDISSADKTFRGNMVNISAGGFAFACIGDEFAEAVGETVRIAVHDFPVLRGRRLTGVVIRSSNNDGTYVVGCRMLQDNMDILDYVNKNM